jgi:hypothetical protein
MRLEKNEVQVLLQARKSLLLLWCVIQRRICTCSYVCPVRAAEWSAVDTFVPHTVLDIRTFRLKRTEVYVSHVTHLAVRCRAGCASGLDMVLSSAHEMMRDVCSVVMQAINIALCTTSLAQRHRFSECVTTDVALCSSQARLPDDVNTAQHKAKSRCITLKSS